jgi:hypothetical protein
MDEKVAEFIRSEACQKSIIKAQEIVANENERISKKQEAIEKEMKELSKKFI